LGFPKDRILNVSILKFIPKVLQDYYSEKFEAAYSSKSPSTTFGLCMLKRFKDLQMYSMDVKVT